tara:strand:+ start:517 stop:633 length:117 start_codon:yes stop_codon:yes gene_type:complete
MDELQREWIKEYFGEMESYHLEEVISVLQELLKEKKCD